MSLLQKIKSQQEKSNMVHKKFIAGGYGLVKTFWLYWFAPIVIITMLDSFISASAAAIIRTNILIVFWSAITLVAIFNTTPDKKLWKNVALVFIALTIITRIFNIIVIL